MSIIERFIRVFAPFRCLGCDREDDVLLCDDCALGLPPANSQCYRCGVATQRYGTCQSCSSTTPLTRVVASKAYRGLSKTLVHHLKYSRARAAAAEIAVLLEDCLRYFPDDVVFVHVPTATSRVRTRGYDQAALLSRAISRTHGVHWVRLLARSGQAHQVGAVRTQRLQQLSGAFRAADSRRIQGRHVVLVDDVVTTGATLEAAARVLCKAGAVQVDALVFARA